MYTLLNNITFLFLLLVFAVHRLDVIPGLHLARGQHYVDQ